MEKNNLSFSKVDVEEAILKFLRWLENYGDHSYDKDDLLDTKYGVLVKKFFYKNKYLLAPFAASLLITETFFPEILSVLCDKRKEAIAEAHYSLGYMNLYKLTSDRKYLLSSEVHLKYLKENAIKGYSGYCWGYSKGWQTQKGYWPENTPCVTTTPYVYSAFKEHYNITKNYEDIQICNSIADFCLYDLKKMPMPNGTFSAQYSTLDVDGSVINSTAYRTFILIDAWEGTGDKIYLDEAELNLNFIISYQNEDGSWPYHAINSKQAMIDNFHTCFILKNLIKVHKILKRDEIFAVIKKGYEYYRNYLFYKDGKPRHYAKSSLVKFRKYEMYDYAEGINLGCELRELIPSAYDKAVFLVNDLVDNYQLKDGHFVTRVTSLGTTHKVPYHRWPQAQLFNYLSKILLVEDREVNNY